MLTAKPCDEVLPELRRAAIRQPNVRSLSLIKEDRIYCGTLDGSTDITIEPGSYVNGHLRVYTSGGATPGSAILLYRLQANANANAVVTASNLRVLQAELLGFQNSVVLSLQFAEQHVWATGNGEYYMIPNHAENTLKLASEDFGYIVHAGYPDGQSWRMIRQAIQSALPSLLLVGIMTSAAGYWGLFRRARTRSTHDQH